jgi:SpoVK/Ycf46/Vps4 family AAA+-type ATPase
MTDTTITAGSKASADVTSLLRARNSLLWIVTREEARAERGICEAAASAAYEPRLWDCATGISDMSGTPVDASMTDPGNVLTKIRDSKLRQVWILRDLPYWLKDPIALRMLRSLARQLQSAPRAEARAIVVLSPVSEIPPELQGHATVIEWPLPDRAEIAKILDNVIAALPEEMQANAAPNGSRDAAIDAAVGLTSEEAQACYAKSLVATKKIEAATVAQEKKRVIAKEKVLEWVDPLPGGLDSVGGLELLKAWLMSRRAAFTPAARAYGLPAPKGALLVGVPGCGKSLTAKAIATALSMPLLRLDFGALKGKFVGESEGNIRKALKVAESMAPCVVWIDEIEKALGGATGPQGDGGVSADALGNFLSWMQDRQGSVFVIATANDVSALPPELLRKGRFDDLFFVDLPTAVERKGVLSAALKAHGRDVSSIDLAAVSAVTADFTGAEIAALVPDSMFAAFADGARPITTADLVGAAKNTAPLARTAAEKITKLREWSKGRARPASIADVAPTTTSRTLDL